MLLVSASCGVVRSTSYHPDKKIGPAVLVNDLKLLKQILEANHPSLYWYTPKDSVDYYFNQAVQSITDSLSEPQFRNIVAPVISKLRCGHTQVRFSKKYADYYRNKPQPQFPLSLKIWNDSAIVVANSHPNDSVLIRGTILTSINGRSGADMLQRMSPYISTDGYADIFKHQLISFSFPSYYKSVFGSDSLYTIGYLDTNLRQQTITIKNYDPRSDSTARRRRLPPLPRITHRQYRRQSMLLQREMVIDTALSLATLRINTFSDGHLRKFFRRSFSTISKLKLENVAIDLRQNSGGSIVSSNRLTQYLIDHEFKTADTVAAISRRFRYRRYIKPWFIYWLSMQLTGRRHTDGRIHFNYFENHRFNPIKKNHFNGHIYVVTGGYTFSAATLVTGALKGQKNVTIVGEETGGGYYGNSAMHLPVITLPGSKLRVVLPMYRLVIDHTRPKDGRGVMPDVEMKPTSEAIKHRLDLKMLKVIDLVRARQQL